MWGFQKYDCFENPLINKKKSLFSKKPCVNANYGIIVMACGDSQNMTYEILLKQKSLCSKQTITPKHRF